MSSLDQAAKKIKQPKTKKERAIEIGTGVAILSAGIAGIVVSGKGIEKYGRKSKVNYSRDENNLESVSVTEVLNPDQSMAKEIAAAIGLCVSTAVTYGGLYKTLDAVFEKDKWVTEEEAKEKKKA